MMIIFGNKYGILLTKYMPCGTTISSPCYALIIERLRRAILKKRHDKVSDGVLLLHGNAPIHKCSIVQGAIRKTDSVESTHLAYSPGITSSDSYLLSNLNKFLYGKNFSNDDETIDTVENYLNKLD